MKTFGQDIDIKNIIKEDHFYIEPKEFKRFIKYVLYQYTIGNNNSFKLIYNPKTGDISKLSKNFEKDYINNILDIENIYFDDYGCIFKDKNGEEAVVSPEFFMLQLLENLKRTPEQVYAFFKGMENELGIDYISNINFSEIREKLENKAHEKSRETQGLYRLAHEYSVNYLRLIEVCTQIEKTIDATYDEIIYYFTDNFDEWDDPEFREKYDKAQKILERRPRQDKIVEEHGQMVQYIDTEYLDLEDRVIEMQQQAEKESLKKFKTKIATTVKIAVNEYIRILQNRLKTKIISYSYIEAEQKRGYINSLGLDEVLYYAHPMDKYLLKRKHDEIIGDSEYDYDNLYIYKCEEYSKDSLNNDGESVIRHINL